ncbi:hypothetical protein [Cellulosimicrobium marinum]|uniref:hypothetical protein n=1 Tax=Cellulosimicrobium marinum TaxID=1638992 RepID=UPI001E50388B|nr:hypothetical protein [Cellulosimicrobium marinum]MCB7135761.1 hypothetical protein [Cellulosimicrobium marinum]
MKRLLASALTTALALGGVAVATAAPASAHTPVVEADCSSLDVNLWAYAKRGNEVTVVVDGQTVAQERFGSSYARSFELDPTVAHTWSVTVDASDRSRYDWSDDGETTPCVQDEGTAVQVGIYLYPKLDASRPAAWENSGRQELLGTTTLTLREDQLRDDTHWFTELPETDLLDDVDLCLGWGIQQDLLRGGPDEYTMPSTITYPDGTSMDGRLVDWQHQELDDFGIALPSAAECATTPEQPTVDEPETVVPTAPAAVDVCGADVDDLTVPESTDEVTYLATVDGVLATPTAGHTFGTELAGYTLREDGSALLPVELLVPAEEECALLPGAISATCEGDTPYLGYEVALPEGVEVDEDAPLTITFLHPRGGEDHVVTGQPLAGRVLWPGASATEPKQWPGYVRNEDGSYTQTDGNFAWTREGVQVLFEVNPSYSTVVDYPPASSECANPPVAPVAAEDVELVADEQGPALASTGATVAGAAAFALLLVAGGGVVLWLRRRVQA